MDFAHSEGRKRAPWAATTIQQLLVDQEHLANLGGGAIVFYYEELLLWFKRKRGLSKSGPKVHFHCEPFKRWGPRASPNFTG